MRRIPATDLASTPPGAGPALAPLSAQWLATLRATRGFEAAKVLACKEARLAAFFRKEGLDAAVVGVSGGVDSALTLALLQRLRQRGVLRRAVGLLLPIVSRGATEQPLATSRGRRVAAALGAEIWEAPLGGAQEALTASLGAAAPLPWTAWAEGQALSILRTPALYGAVALLRAHGFAAVVVGTTNRDEGCYLGFYGKASDGMVDVQPLADLHKSEVRALARLCGVPDEIVDATPTGNVFDGRNDEEMLEAGYDEIELFLRLREVHRADLADALPWAAALLLQHAHNQHKYRVGQPSVTVDVLPRGVPGGTRDEVWTPRHERCPPPGTLPGQWEPDPALLAALRTRDEKEVPGIVAIAAILALPALPAPSALPLLRALSDPPLPLPAVSRLDLGRPGLALVADDVLSVFDCAALCEAMALSGQAEPVSVTGLRDPSSVAYGVGSVRATAWAPELAKHLGEKLAPAIPSVRFVERTGWRALGLSPVLRFMRYESGGHHLGHYDAPFDYGDGRCTLMSVVFYLTTAEDGGATRFLRDGQDDVPIAARSYDDWAREALPAEILLRVAPRRGRVLLFDHRLCHDVERWNGPGPRVIIRADVVYEAIPDGVP